MRAVRVVGCVVWLAACGSGAGGEPPEVEADASVGALGAVPAEAQRDGDPAAGYDALINRGYVSCGIPASLYDQFFGQAPPELRLEGRSGRNATLPYSQTAFTTATGVEVVSANCLSCHAGWLNGELVIGLGDHAADFTDDVGSAAELAGNFISDSDVLAKAEWRKWADRVVAIAGYTQTDTVGVNPADNLAAVLFAHRDRDTLAWSYQPLLELPPQIVVPVDTPPWWNMRYKHAMFYVGAGRGDHARLMMSASALCTDSVEEAAAIDTYFPDVAAYIRSLEPPPWPYPVDAELAAAGRVVYEMRCSHCHGTYAVDPADAPAGDDYPNLIIGLDEVGTDATLATAAGQFAGRFVDWFNNSFYGGMARLMPAPGYYAPPLRGIWASAPYLHNGSVPTLAALLDSSTRPSYWTRSFDSSDYDPAAVGWRFTPLDHGKEGEQDKRQRALIYDTTRLGYGNAGHGFGDGLTAEERLALLEYLKTL